MVSPPTGWQVMVHYDLQGDNYIHPRLVSLLEHRLGQVSVEYRTEHWIHTRFSGFWETTVCIHSNNRVLACLNAMAPRHTHELAILEAAHHALVVYSNQSL
jgi:hypothetical protein